MKNKISQFKAVLVIIIANILFSSFIFAQSSEKLSYQAVVRNATNELVVETQIGMKISIIQNSVSGTVVYTETQTPTTNENGLLSVIIGEGPDFNLINWASDVFFVKTEIDPAGGTNYTITGVTQLLSVPYALYAAKAGAVNETDPLFSAWDKSSGINITESQITDLQDYALTTYVDDIYLNLKLDIYAQIGVSDVDGNHYSAVRIGDQVWMAENLKTTKLNDGTYLENVADPSDWTNWNDPAMCWFYNDITTYKSIFGGLYNWHAVNTSTLCPQGWHVPSSIEWDQLVTFLGGDLTAGGALKETGIIYWPTPNVGATNSTGFSARACGRREASAGSFVEDYEVGLFWTSTSVDAQKAYEKTLYPEGTMVQTLQVSKYQGNSVRCVKD